MTPPPQPDAGFTLIEAMVAMLILGIAAVGLSRATQGHIDLIRGLQARAAAQWVAENRLVELAVEPTAADGGEKSVEMLGQRFKVQVRMRATDDPDLSRADVSVSQPGASTPLLTLTGFVDMGAAR